MSKRGDALKFWMANKHKVIQDMKDRDIYGCEVRLDGCNGMMFPTPAHRHKRDWYINRKELLIDIDEVIWACQRCHQKIENNKQLTEEVFKKLRP